MGAPVACRKNSITLSFLIRVFIPDTPGSLGLLATAFGDAGINIRSVDIVESFEDGTVTDDMVVELPAGALADSVLTTAAQVPGVEIDSIRPFSGRVDRRGQIKLLASIAAQRSDAAALQEVCSAIPNALTSTWAIVIDNTDPIRRVAWSEAAPEDDGSTPAAIDVTGPRILNPEREEWIPDSWALLDSALAAAPLGKSGKVLVMGRVGGPEFLASEVEHLGHLGTIVGAFLRH